MPNPTELSLLEASEQIRAGQLSPVELTRSLLDAISWSDNELGSFVSVSAEVALGQAKAAEDELGRGGRRGPLHGIPVALKDIIATRDYPTHVGSVLLENWHPGRDSAVAARLRAAGAIILGKTTTTEAAFMEHHPTVAAPRNPWHRDSWCGVSSSGSGVATAAGLCFGALGTDTGGSIRFPAYCCGLVGLKPTWGRVSRAGVFPLAPSLDHIGPMTRSVADTAALFAAIAGWDPSDPTSLRVAAPNPESAIEPGARGIRVGFDEWYCGEGLDPLVANALREATQVLRDAGAQVVPVTLPSAREAVDAFPTLVSSEAAAVHADTPEERRGEYSPSLRSAIEAGDAGSATDYVRAHHARLCFRGALDAIWETIDVYLAPAWARTTPTIAEYASSSDSELAGLIEYTAPQNLAGVPCLCLPAGFDKAGVPFGFQVVGPALSEATLFRTGQAYERGRPEPSRRPRGAWWRRAATA